MIANKHSDYGESNILDFGELGILVRANDKISRLKNLEERTIDQPKIQETIDDTWADLAGYAIIALMLRRNLFTEKELK